KPITMSQPPPRMAMSPCLEESPGRVVVTHSHRLPPMSWMPRGVSPEGKLPTLHGSVRLFGVEAQSFVQSSLVPHGYLRARLPPRAAHSHSSSVAIRLPTKEQY